MGNQVVTLIEDLTRPTRCRRGARWPWIAAWCPARRPRASLRHPAVVEPLGATAHIPVQPVLTHTGLRLDGPSFYPGWLLAEEDPLLAAGQATCRTLSGSEPAVGVGASPPTAPTRPAWPVSPRSASAREEEQYVHTALDQVSLSKLRKAAAFYALFPFVYSNSTPEQCRIRTTQHAIRTTQPRPS